MIDRKIWKGDLLRLTKGNAFYGHHDVVAIHSDGYATAWEDSEADDPLVEIDGGKYIVKRADLHELNTRENAMAHAAATIRYAGLNKETPERIAAAAEILRAGQE